MIFKHRSLALAAMTVIAALTAGDAEAGFFGRKPAPAHATPAAASVADDIQRSLDESRYVDAGAMLDRAAVAGLASPRLTLLSGELFLARGRYEDAVKAFESAARTPGERPRALQGKGLILSLQGKSDQALPILEQAVLADGGLWRAWNGIGREYDLRREWVRAEQAYGAALATPGAKSAVVLNNRGYSRLLQGRLDEATADLVRALESDPSMRLARTNLRLTLAARGDYSRAAAGGVGDDRAAILNNVGLSAALRGDYGQAESLLSEAMAARGEYYARASQNLELSRGLKARDAGQEGVGARR